MSLIIKATEDKAIKYKDLSGNVGELIGRKTELLAMYQELQLLK
jgi:hypothetical protein